MDFNRRWDFSEIFSTTPGAAVTFDIGFGSGESLIEMAVARPKEYFVGIEVHKPGVAAALARLEEEGLTNAKIVQGDAITALTDHVEDGSLSACCIFFPDPFPQDRDAGRRLVRPLLLSLLSSKLRAGGMLHVATDVEAYAEHTVRVMNTMGAPENLLKPSSPSPSISIPSWSPPPAVELAQKEERNKAEVESREENISRRAGRLPLENDASDSPVRSPQQEQQEGVKGDNDSGHPLDKIFARWLGGELQERPPSRPLTRYEEKAREAGRRVRDFTYRLESQTTSCQPTLAVAAEE
ncbi:unnamed protein product [Scytosiphon promiscuus]